MTTSVMCKTLVPWLFSRSQPGIKVIIRGLRGHLLPTVTVLVFKYLHSFNKLDKSSINVDVRKHLNIQEAFSSEQAHSKTENSNLSCGEPKTPAALKLSVGVFDPLINPYWLKEATTAIKILQSLGNDLQEILRFLCCH